MKEITGHNGWRYVIQREHVRGEGPYFSLMVAPPDKPTGYVQGFEKDRAILPIRDDSYGTRYSVRKVILRHIKHIKGM